MIGVSARNLSKAYPRTGPALGGVSFDVAPGAFVCLLGPSGSGKSTLLNVISGLEQDYSGDLSFSPPDPRRAYVFQEARLLPWLTLRGNLRFVLDRPDDASVERWLGLVGLAGAADYYPRQLSVGMQQRAALARALITGPDLLLMDEPFSSLDELTAMQMRLELLRLWQGRATVLFVTHNPLEAVYLADRVLVFSARPGRVAADVPVPLPRPRDYGALELWRLSRELAAVLGVGG